MLFGTILPIVGLCVALLVALVGALGMIEGARTIRTRFRTGRTEPQPVHQLSPGGYVEVVGGIDEMNTDTITAPFSGTECVAYEYRLLQQDSTSWRVAEGGNGTEFIVDSDTTGETVEIDPDEESPGGAWETVASPSPNATLPDETRNVLEDHPDIDTDERPEFFAETSDSLRRYQERRLGPDEEELYVFGNSDTSDVHKTRIDAERSSDFIMGTEPAGSFGGSLVVATLRLIVGFVLLLLGLYGAVLALEALGVDVPFDTALPIGSILLGTVSPVDAGTAIGAGTVIAPSSVRAVVLGGVGAAPGIDPAMSGLVALLPDVRSLPVLSLSLVDAAVPLFIALVFGAPGLYIAWKALGHLWTAARIFSNQPVEPGEAALLDGVVELEGTVQPADGGAIESPYAGEPAVISEFRMREQETERRRTRDSDGNRKTERRKTWNTNGQDSFERNFVVESGGQTIEVDPTGATRNLGDYETIHKRTDTSTLPQEVRLRLSASETREIGDPASLISQSTSNKQRFQERRLAVGDSIHLYGGEVDDPSDPEPLVVNGGDSYKISKGTELRTVLRRGTKGLLILLLSLPFLLLGGYALSVAIQTLL